MGWGHGNRFGWEFLMLVWGAATCGVVRIRCWNEWSAEEERDGAWNTEGEARERRGRNQMLEYSLILRKIKLELGRGLKGPSIGTGIGVMARFLEE